MHSLLCICIYFFMVYLSDQIALNYVVCIYFASPGASHLLIYFFSIFGGIETMSETFELW